MERTENKVNALKNDIVVQMQCQPVKLTSTQSRLQRYLLEHVVEVGYLSLKELSARAKVSEVSILNFCGLWGFESYIALRESFRQHTRARMQGLLLEPPGEVLTWEQREELYQYCAEITAGHNDMLQGLELQQLDRCARVLTASRDILVFAHDMSKIAADYLVSRLGYLHIRSQSVNLGDNDTVQMLLSGLDARDSVVMFSFPPYYLPARDVADYVRHCGAQLITIADSTDSPAVAEDSIHFCCKTKNPYFFNSMSVPIHFVEILAYCISMTMGKRKEDIVDGINAIGSYFQHNKNRGDERIV